MKFTLKPLASLNSFVLAGLLAAAGASAMAQTAPLTPVPAPAAMGRQDPAQMQAVMVKRQAEMKAKLKITPAQEGAWTAFTAAMQPPVHGARPTATQRAEIDKLSTPERIDKMREMRTQRMAEMNTAMDQRGAATKTFYTALSAEQQKTFDAEHKMHGKYEGRGRHEGGMHHKG